MKNIHNKTKTLNEVNLLNFEDLLLHNPVHIATVSKNGDANLSIATATHIVDDNTFLICNKQMENTPDNVLANGKIVLTCFNKNFEGIRLSGIASYETSGAMFDLVLNKYSGGRSTVKGCIVIKIFKIEELV